MLSFRAQLRANLVSSSVNVNIKTKVILT